jgi:hypothetical protein
MNKPPVVLVVQNELDAPIGYLEEWLFERGVAIEVIYPFKGDAVPTEPGDFAGVIVLGGSRGVHDEDQWPWLKQEKELLRNENVIDTVFRPSSKNKFVVNEVINVKKMAFMKSKALVSKFNKKVFLGKCENCLEMCGIKL